MRNRFQMALIAVLVALSAYLFITGRHETDSLKNEIRSLDARLSQKDAEYEARIARLKAGAGGEKGERVAVAKRPMPNLIAGLSGNILQKRRETFEKMSAVLKLTAIQKEQISNILQDFRTQKSQVLGKISAGKMSIFDPALVGEVNGLRQEAMARVKSVLNGQQYRMFREKGYEERLGLHSDRAGNSSQ